MKKDGTAATWYERLRQRYFNAPFGVLDTPVTATRLWARNSAAASLIVVIEEPPSLERVGATYGRPDSCSSGARVRG